MAKQTEKINILEDAGYRYNFDRMMYINRNVRKAFSVEFIDDKAASEITEKIQHQKANEDWEFYTTSHLSDGIVRELKRVLQ
ncbi:hypothetical protein [Granulicella tundricola]|uniref:Uncharacterized protein n=1 Tax=Granulicella tundricola (strain ATCC BAA-1859 / DSM 23138 / MP5ACTX9) TaxID=1198114 RepID=E8X549_GRATM|nr:hypothetical protein [Granulicella tundricola]ADW68313.1 hypothetical protein AciX9_1251 [Granulicella tundricola MP5ACTX9]